MYVRFTLGALAILIGLGGAAHADILAGGPVYGGPPSFGGTFVCRIFNFGVLPVTITTRQIFTNTGASVALSSDTCNVPVAATKGCAYTSSNNSNFSYSCRIFAIGNDVNISGVAEITTPANSILNSVPFVK